MPLGAQAVLSGTQAALRRSPAALPGAPAALRRSPTAGLGLRDAIMSAGPAQDTVVGPDGVPRCRWAASAPELIAYHDREWGYPVADDRRLFEKLCLEGFQCGLSWRTILAKRERFRAVFCGFDFERVAAFDGADVARLLEDPGIIRHRGKIEATISNAARACELVAREGSLGAFIWSFEPLRADPGARHDAPSSPASIALSRELKRRGWRFVGPTTVHAFMQSMGLINDHLEGCAQRRAAEQQRAAFTPPGHAG